jgi:hypothetical protein
VAKKRKKAKSKLPKDKYSTGQLFNFAQNSYLERTSRPVYAIVFLLPFIVFYEIGTILINTDVLNRSQVRVVAFVWLQNILEYLGTGSRLAWVAPPLVVVAILIGLQMASRKRWGFSFRDVFPMTLECILLAVPLIVFSLFLKSLVSSPPDARDAALTVTSGALPYCSSAVNDVPLPSDETEFKAPEKQPLLANIVTGIGAGIYEELVFRLILICLLMMLFQDALGLSHNSSVILSVLISAALFSAHHHVAFADGRLGRIAAFNWTEFGFRTMAGIYFAILFAMRGFGITAGTHAFYDILATVINVFLPHQ